MSKSTCSVTNCDTVSVALGLCSKHYNRMRVHGTTELPERPTILCSVAGCDRKRERHGMCAMHAQRVKRHGTPDEPPRRTRPTCSVEGCNRPHAARGYCMSHYRRVRATGDPGPAEIRSQNLNSVRRVSQNGYVFIKVPDHPRSSRGWVREHIAVMEQTLGRYLLPGEEVHHLNGKRDDNRPENLELWVVRQPKGQRPEDLVLWAREILARYGQDNAH